MHFFKTWSEFHIAPGKDCFYDGYLFLKSVFLFKRIYLFLWIYGHGYVNRNPSEELTPHKHSSAVHWSRYPSPPSSSSPSRFELNSQYFRRPILRTMTHIPLQRRPLRSDWNSQRPPDTFLWRGDHLWPLSPLRAPSTPMPRGRSYLANDRSYYGRTRSLPLSQNTQLPVVLLITSGTWKQLARACECECVRTLRRWRCLTRIGRYSLFFSRLSGNERCGRYFRV